MASSLGNSAHRAGICLAQGSGREDRRVVLAASCQLPIPSRLNAERRERGNSTPGVSVPRRALLLATPTMVSLFSASGGAQAGLSFPGLGGGRGGDTLSYFGPGADIRNPGVAWSVGQQEKQLYYPDWFEGTWAVEARFQGLSNPMGQRFVSRTTPGVTMASMVTALPDVGAGMDQSVAYQTRFLRDPDQGNRIVADRTYNYTQLMDAFLGYASVQSVEYDPYKNPTRLAVRYRTKRRDNIDQDYDNRKAEIFINNRTGELIEEGHFVTTELFRQVSQAKASGNVGDFEIISDWRLVSDDEMSVRQRVAAFLQPQDALYFDVGSKAVALYDYTMTMRRVA